MAKKNARLKSGKQVADTVSASATGPVSPMNLELLEQITRLMRENDLNAIDVRDGEKRIIVKRGLPAQMVSVASSAPTVSHHHAPTSPTASSSGGGSASTEAANADANLVPIKSPMVGTFYSSPSPDAKPFVAVGSTVDDESDVCVIEAMKVFNNIKAETRGTIAKVLVTNGSTVEFGQVLFLVKP